MSVKRLHYKGSNKKIYLTEADNRVILEFSTDSKKRNEQADLDAAALSMYLFEYLESYNIHTHYIEKHDHNSFVAKKLEMIPLRFSLYNTISKSLAKKLLLTSTDEVKLPLLRCTALNSEDYTEPMAFESLIDRNLASEEDIRKISRVMIKSNAILKTFFMRRGIELVEFNLEFGKFRGQLLIGDDLAPEKLKFRRERKAAGQNLTDDHQQLFNRITGA